MKQYARLRLPSNNNGNGGRPTLIWHTYAAIEATVREGEWGRGEGGCQTGNGNGNGNRAISSVMGMAMGDCEWGSTENLSVSFSLLSLSVSFFLDCLAAFIDLN